MDCISWQVSRHFLVVQIPPYSWWRSYDQSYQFLSNELLISPVISPIESYQGFQDHHTNQQTLPQELYWFEWDRKEEGLAIHICSCFHLCHSHSAGSFLIWWVECSEQAISQMHQLVLLIGYSYLPLYFHRGFLQVYLYHIQFPRTYTKVLPC